ncbi:PucR family transcriptional regulator [Microbacterium sp.]|jgi:hypothetical protein|uniref:PucR family transcriptional regulator n=1 Tax=Microbacterium sp. TaxID=51671 RepID=UPI0037C8FF67
MVDAVPERHATLAREMVETVGAFAAAHDLGALRASVLQRARILVPSDAAILVYRQDGGEAGTDVVAEGLRDTTVVMLKALLTGDDAHTTFDPLEVAQHMAQPSAPTSEGRRAQVLGALAAEGMRAVLSAPLRASADREGILLLARRAASGFDPDESDALELLARCAAPLHRGARAALSGRERMAALEQDVKDSTARLDALRELVSMEQDLLSAILPSVRQEAFAEHVSRTLGCAVTVVDAGVPLWDQPLDADLVDIVAAQLHVARPAVEPTVVGEALDGRAVTWMAVGVQGELLGGIATTAVLSERDRERLRHARAAVSAYLAWMRSTRELQFREQVELVEELMSSGEGADSALMSARLADHGLASPPFSVVVAAVDPAHRTEGIKALSRGIRPSVSAVHGGSLCVITRADQSLALAERVHEVLADHGIPAAVGCDGPSTSPLDIRANYDVARSIVGTLVATGRTDHAGDRFTVGALGLLISHGGAESSRILVRRTIGKVLDHDADRGTPLARTALAYLDANQSVRASASHLRVHENTVRQRVERIDELLTDAWRVGPRALDHHVAFRLWATLAHLPD